VLSCWKKMYARAFSVDRTKIERRVGTPGAPDPRGLGGAAVAAGWGHAVRATLLGVRATVGDMLTQHSHHMAEDGRLEPRFWWRAEHALHRWRGPQLTDCDGITLTEDLRVVASAYTVSLDDLIDSGGDMRRLVEGKARRRGSPDAARR
jgi:hypothetical protein